MRKNIRSNPYEVLGERLSSASEKLEALMHNDDFARMIDDRFVERSVRAAFSDGTSMLMERDNFEDVLPMIHVNRRFTVTGFTASLDEARDENVEERQQKSTWVLSARMQLDGKQLRFIADEDATKLYFETADGSEASTEATPETGPLLLLSILSQSLDPTYKNALFSMAPAGLRDANTSRNILRMIGKQLGHFQQRTMAVFDRPEDNGRKLVVVWQETERPHTSGQNLDLYFGHSSLRKPTLSRSSQNEAIPHLDMPGTVAFTSLFRRFSTRTPIVVEPQDLLFTIKFGDIDDENGVGHEASSADYDRTSLSIMSLLQPHLTEHTSRFGNTHIEPEDLGYEDPDFE